MRHHCNPPSAAWPENARPGDTWTCPECGNHMWAEGDMDERWLLWRREGD